MTKSYRLLAMILSLSGCFGIRAVGSGPLLERPNYSIKVDPSQEGSEVTVTATITNTSPTHRLDLRTAHITHLSKNFIELSPTEVVGECLTTVLEPQQSCVVRSRYEITGMSPFPTKWEFVLDGEVVQFTLAN